MAGTLWMMVGFGVRIIAQAAFFILVARSLRVSGYGTFMAAASLSATAVPFAGLGTGNLLIKYVSRDRDEFEWRWGNVLIVTTITALALVVLLVIAGLLFLSREVPIGLIAVVGVADLVFGRVLDACSQAYQCAGQLKRTAQLQALPTVGKIVGAVALVLIFSAPTAMHWAWFYLAAAFGTTGIGLWLVKRELGRAKFRFRTAFDGAREGWHFSVGLAAQSVYNDVDKTMLAALSTPGSVGIYAAAYRIVDVSFAPVRSLLYASYTEFFRAGVHGLRGTVAHARRLIGLAASCGAGASIALFTLAPVVPLILGADYSNTVVAIRWLALLPLLKSVHYLAADSLTGAGLQSVRSHIQIAVAIFNIVLNGLLIPTYSWVGAAWASIASDSVLAVCLWIVVWRLRMAGSRTAPMEVVG